MHRGRLRAVVGRLHRLAGRSAGAPDSDRQLLARFAGARDEEAFARLVERHGPMVLAVCRRLLGQEQDAEDAFQASFLVLARKAHAVAWRESVAGWLFEVAHRVARGARRAELRRRHQERQAAAMHPPDLLSDTPPASPAGDPEICRLLDEELGRLPEKYRTPLVLCYLEGRTHTEAAGQLGWPVGTVRGRMARGRDLLRRRLARRGLTLPAVAVGAALGGPAAQAVVPATLAGRTVRVVQEVAAGAALAQTASARVAALAEESLRSMAAARLQRWGLLLLAGVLVGGTALAASRFGAVTPPAAEGRVSLEASPTHLERTPLQMTGGVREVAFAPDGKLLALAGEDTGVRLWDRTAGRQVGCLNGHTDLLHVLVFSSDGRRLASAARDGTVCVWDLTQGGRRVGLRRNFGPTELAGFAGDDRLLAVAGPASAVRLWDYAAGKDLLTLAGPVATVGQIAVAPDGRVVASASDGLDPVISLWDVTGGGEPARAGKEFRRLVPDLGRVVSLALTEGGTLLAVASRKMETRPTEVSLWEVETGRMRHRLPGPHGDAVHLSSDGRLLVTSGRGRPAVLWDLTPTREPRRLWGSPVPASATALSQDGRILAWSAGGSVHLFDIAAGKPLDQAFGANPGGDLPAREPDRGAPSAEEDERLWGDLAASGAAGERGMNRLVAAADRAVAFLKRHLEQDRSLPERLDWLITRLADEDLSCRQAAAAELGRLRTAAEPRMRQALRAGPTPEVRRRLEALLRLPAPQVREPIAEERRLIRAAVVLARIGTAESQRVLESLVANPALPAALAETDFDPALVAEVRSALHLPARPSSDRDFPEEGRLP